MKKYSKKRSKKKNRQGISLCMIVKNEEAYLPDCLKSVQSLVDEMIIVDTGSSDPYISINPEVAEAHFSSGFLFFKKGYYAKAKNSFKRVLAIDHSHETARKNLEVLEKMGVA